MDADLILPEIDGVPAEALAELPDHLQEALTQGWITASEGRNPMKPVLRYTKDNGLGKIPGTLAKGSGVSPKHVDSGNGRRGGWKNTNAYKDLLQVIIPPDADPKKFGSFGWLVNQGFEAARGGTETFKFKCSECRHDNKVEVWKKPDGNAVIKLIELVHGRATESREVDVNAKHLHAFLEEGVALDELGVFTIDPKEADRRRETIEAIDDGGR